MEPQSKQPLSHNHVEGEICKNQEGSYLQKRDAYCRLCKLESKTTDPRANDFDLSTCFEVEPENKINQYNRNELDYYFDSYSHFNIHEDMLKDESRTKTYMNAILKNKHLFKDKIVLDVGCGTGILSIFAAKAGAKHVYAVDNSDIAFHAVQIIKANNLSDKITVYQKLMEEVELPVEKVDIIISEWMGYFLLYESMLDCILDARDKYLAPDGILLPDKVNQSVKALRYELFLKAIMFITTFCNDTIIEDRFTFWDSVYGIDMSCMKSWVFAEPFIEEMDRNSLNGDIVKLIEFDLQKVKKEELNFVADYSIQTRRDDFIQGVGIWWEVQFCKGSIPLKLSTSPFSKETHWKQTMFFIKDEEIPMKKEDYLKGKIAVKKNSKNPRDLDVKISFKLENEQISFERSQIYKMN